MMQVKSKPKVGVKGLERGVMTRKERKMEDMWSQDDLVYVDLTLIVFVLNWLRRKVKEIEQFLREGRGGEEKGVEGRQRRGKGREKKKRPRSLKGKERRQIGCKRKGGSEENRNRNLPREGSHKFRQTDQLRQLGRFSPQKVRTNGIRKRVRDSSVFNYNRESFCGPGER